MAGAAAPKTRASSSVAIASAGVVPTSAIVVSARASFAGQGRVLVGELAGGADAVEHGQAAAQDGERSAALGDDGGARARRSARTWPVSIPREWPMIADLRDGARRCRRRPRPERYAAHGKELYGVKT